MPATKGGRGQREAGVRRFVAQSFASGRNAREGGMVKSEDDPLEPTPMPSTRQSHAAMRHLEQVVTDAGGIVLRYGGFYGAANDALIEPVRKRQFPIVGDGGGYSSWIHLDDAAAATVLALEHDGPAIYNIVDDEPAPVREWLPLLADALGAKPPRHVPVWLARLIAGDAAVMMGTDARAASTPTRSASSASRCATRAGGRASPRSTRNRRRGHPSLDRPRPRTSAARGRRLDDADRRAVARLLSIP
jgi:nucleoside-diphosphate-sugar epimerase